MNRIEFMNRLEQLLQNLPEDEKREALRYYNDYFDDAGAEREYEVIQELVSPEHVAQTVYDSAGFHFSGYGSSEDSSTEQSYGSFGGDNGQIPPNQAGYGYDNYQENPQKKTNTGMIIAIIVLIVTAPVTIPVIFSIISVIFSVIIGIFGCIIGFFIAGVGLLIGAVALFVVGIPVVGLLCLGLGFGFLCLEMLLLPFVVWLCRTVIPALFRLIKKGIQKLFQKGGNMQ